MRGRPVRQRGLTLAEIIMAIGFLAVFTTGLLAIATKGFGLSGREIDMAAAYQHCETLMENYSHQSTRSQSWVSMTTIEDPKFPVSVDEDGVETEDKNFCYTVEVKPIGTDLKKVQVRIFLADTAETVPTPDANKPRGGEVLRMTNFYPRP